MYKDVYEFIANSIEKLPVEYILYQKNRPRVICKDGYSISIQASENHYCEPRENFLKSYNSVELGLPSEPDELINDYAEDVKNYKGTVYGYVPINLVNKLIEKHGGIKEVKGKE